MIFKDVYKDKREQAIGRRAPGTSEVDEPNRSRKTTIGLATAIA